MFKRRGKFYDVLPRERFVFKAKNGNYLDVTHLFKKNPFPYKRFVLLTLLWALIGLYITALIEGI